MASSGLVRGLGAPNCPSAWHGWLTAFNVCFFAKNLTATAWHLQKFTFRSSAREHAQAGAPPRRLNHGWGEDAALKDPLSYPHTQSDQQQDCGTVWRGLQKRTWTNNASVTAQRKGLHPGSLTLACQICSSKPDRTSTKTRQSEARIHVFVIRRLDL